MNPLYNIGIGLFKGGASIAALRSAKIAEMLRGGRDTLSTLADTRSRVAPEGYDVWIHAASLGEFEQGRPLIEKIRAEYPEKKILLTFFSPSGYRVRHAYDRVDTVAYLPIDTPSAATAFLDAAAPHMAIFIKYEFWGNYLEQLALRGIPTYSISAIFRPGQRFFKRSGAMWRKMLLGFDHIYVQDEASAHLLRGIGCKGVTVAGDTRFDRVATISQTAKNLPVSEKLCAGSPFTLVVGSSWEPDEDILVPWLNAHPDVRAVIAPHEFDGERLDDLKKRFNGRAELLSQVTPDTLSENTRILIIDTFGLLSSIYRYADAAYVGGGFGTGIHNINEAAAYGIPVVFGPEHRKFKEATDLLAEGGAFEVRDAASLAAIMDRLASDSDFRKKSGDVSGGYIARNIGATDIIFKDLFSSKHD